MAGKSTVNPFEAWGVSARKHTPGDGERVHLYGLYLDNAGKRYVETLQIRELLGGGRGSRLLDDVETGETFRTWKEAIRVNGEKNGRVAAGLKQG